MKSRSALHFVVIIGIANFFADFTYEGARGIIGPFLGSLGASAAIVGFVAGLGELLGYGLRSVSGYFADKSHKHWAFAFFGICDQHARRAGVGAYQTMAARCDFRGFRARRPRHSQTECGSHAFICRQINWRRLGIRTERSTRPSRGDNRTTSYGAGPLP